MEPDGFSFVPPTPSATNCFPPIENVQTLALLAAGKDVSQTILPVFLSNAHSFLSAAPLINTNPPAVTIGPDRANNPVIGPPFYSF